MIIKKAELETVCGITSTFPENTDPEIVFAGKSNVGKSSLINSLMNRKSLARTSSQPGKTQTMNDDLYFVDLPGYGYANANLATKEKWGKMIEKYLHTSKQIRCIFLLIDIRHEPGKNDKQMYDWIVYNGFQPVIIATKLDKLKRSQVAKCVKIVREGLGLPKNGVLIPFSSQTKQGREEVYEFIENLLAEEQV